MDSSPLLKGDRLEEFDKRYQDKGNEGGTRRERTDRNGIIDVEIIMSMDFPFEFCVQSDSPPYY